MTIFKQYGEQRTGTNLLKRLLELNFADVVVFGSVLGWKHGLFHLANGSDSRSARSHEDWVRQKEKGGQVFSVDNLPLPYTSDFLLKAAGQLNYLISFKQPLPWLVSLKRFRFPKKDFEEAHVKQLFRVYTSNYRTWLQLPNALVIDHDLLLEDDKCRCLLQHIATRYGLTRKGPQIVHERRVVKASTDHGLLLADTAFDREYYLSQRYLKDLPPWVVELSQQERFNADFVARTAWRPRQEATDCSCR